MKESPSMDENKVKRKTVKGEIDSTDLKRQINTEIHPQINHITCNQTQEYFAVATSRGFEIIQNDSSSDKLKKKS